MIAEYAMRNYNKAVMYEPLSESLAQLRKQFLYRQMVVRHRCSFQMRRGEKRLTMEKSPIKTMISQSGRHIVSELNKEVEKIDKRITELIKSDKELTEVFTILTSVPGIGTQKRCLPDGIHRQLPSFQLRLKEDFLLLWYSPIRQGFGHQRAFRFSCALYGDPPDQGHADAGCTGCSQLQSRYGEVLYAICGTRKEKAGCTEQSQEQTCVFGTAMVRNRQIYTSEYKITA